MISRNTKVYYLLNSFLDVLVVISVYTKWKGYTDLIQLLFVENEFMHVNSKSLSTC